MNIEPLKSLCTSIISDSEDTCGYIYDFIVFRYDTTFNTITIYSPEVPSSYQYEYGVLEPWTCKQFTSTQDALNELIQSISKIKYFIFQSKLQRINNDF